jgi:hypothetical protein
MKVDTLDVGDSFTNSERTRVKVLTADTIGEEVKCVLKRMEGPLQGASNVHTFPIVNGQIDLGESTNFRPAPKRIVH